MNRRLLSFLTLLAAAALAQPIPPPSTSAIYFLGRGDFSLFGQAVASGPGGDIWVGGVATGNGLPAVNAFRSEYIFAYCNRTIPCPDIFLSRLRGDGQGAVFSTYLGGIGADNFVDLAVDAQGNAYVTGLTSSGEFPFTAEPEDRRFGTWAFVVKMSPTGELVYAYALPGPIFPKAIAVDAAGAAYVGGSTWGEIEQIGGLEREPRSAQVFRTDDGGAGWIRRGDGTGDVNLTTSPGAFQAVTRSGGVRLYARSERAMYRSDDRGESWVEITPPLATETSSITGYSAAGDRVAAVVDCTVFVSSNGGRNWESTFSTDTQLPCLIQVALAPGRPERAYLGGAVFENGNLRGFLQISDDGGRTWEPIQPQAPPVLGWLRGIRAAPDDPAVIYASFSNSTTNTVYRSDDSGRNWRRIYEGTDAVPEVDPAATSTLYLAPLLGSGAAMFRSLDRGESWEAITAGPGQIGGIVNVTAAFGVVYVTTNEGRVYASEDRGETWNDKSAQFPVYAIEADPVRQGTLYSIAFYQVGDGFLLKLNPAGTALEYMTALGGAGIDEVSDIAVDEQGRVLAVGTTQSPDFPITSELGESRPGFHSDAFLTWLGAHGDALLFSAFWGGSGYETEARLAVRDGVAWIAGYTSSRDLPLIEPISSDPGAAAAYWVAQIDPRKASVSLSSYLGRDQALRPPAVAIDAAGVAYVSGESGAWFDPQSDRPPQPFLMRIGADGRLLAMDPLQAYALDAAGPGSLVTVGNSLPGLTEATIGFGGAVRVSSVQFTPSDVPAPWVGAIVSAADSSPRALTPQTIVSIYGRNLAGETLAATPVDGRFPFELGGVRALVNGKAAPVLFVSPDQINAVTPQDFEGEPLVPVVIESGAAPSNVLTFTPTDVLPSTFAIGAAEERRAIVLGSDADLISVANPARRGETLTIWATGVGPLTPTLADGEVAPSAPPFPLAEKIVGVHINLARAELLYAGAAPGVVAGLVQINFVVPQDAAPGEGQLMLEVTSETFAGFVGAGRVWVEP